MAKQSNRKGGRHEAHSRSHGSDRDCTHHHRDSIGAVGEDVRGTRRDYYDRQWDESSTGAGSDPRRGGTRRGTGNPAQKLTEEQLIRVRAFVESDTGDPYLNEMKRQVFG